MEEINVKTTEQQINWYKYPTNADDYEVVCFHSPGEPNDFLTNWCVSRFEVGGISYSSVEQYMMYQKAIIFNDMETAKRILNTADSDFARIKKLGREVKNYDDEVWAAKRVETVYTGVLNKFKQNKDLKEQLLATGDRLLAECAVRDLIWGIGLSMNDPKRLKRSLWRGKNLLGLCLMTAREQLRQPRKQ